MVFNRSLLFLVFFLSLATTSGFADEDLKLVPPQSTPADPMALPEDGPLLPAPPTAEPQPVAPVPEPSEPPNASTESTPIESAPPIQSTPSPIVPPVSEQAEVLPTPSPTTPPVVVGTLDMELLVKKTQALKEAWTHFLTENTADKVTLVVMLNMERTRNDSKTLYHAYKKPWSQALNLQTANVGVGDFYNAGKLRPGIAYLADSLASSAILLAKNDPSVIDERLQLDWAAFDSQFRSFYAFTQNFVAHTKLAVAGARTLSRAEVNYYRNQADGIHALTEEVFNLAANCQSIFVIPSAEQPDTWYQRNTPTQSQAPATGTITPNTPVPNQQFIAPSADRREGLPAPAP